MVGKATQFTSENQPPPENKGPGKKYSLLKKIKNQLFNENEWIDLKGVDLLKGGKVTGKMVDVRVKLTSAEALVMNYCKLAATDKDIMRDAIDRIDGKAPQVFGVGLLDGDEMEVIFDGLGGGDNYKMRKEAEDLLIDVIAGEDVVSDIKSYFERAKEEFGEDIG